MIIITGATGNIGSKLTGLLLSQGQHVRIIGRNASKLQSFADKGAETSAGDLKDTQFLAKAFSGGTAVFAMIPPHYMARDFRAYQNDTGASIAAAIRDSGIKNVVNLSSQGGNLTDKTGPIKGLHDQEERLNKLDSVNILHVRPTYFMENLLANIPLIKNMNIAGSAIRGDQKFAMIATRDIAAFVAERLIKRDFTGKSVRDLLGQRDLSMDEAIAVIAKKINKPDLKYLQFSYEDAEKGLMAAGLSEDVSRLFIEMSRALNEGLFAVNVPRTDENTTATSIEEFADTFTKIYFSELVTENSHPAGIMTDTALKIMELFGKHARVETGTVLTYPELSNKAKSWGPQHFENLEAAMEELRGAGYAIITTPHGLELTELGYAYLFG